MARHDHLALGRYGEDRAAHWYRAHGYVVLDRNWRCPAGEVDLVVLLEDACRRGPEVVVVEVKTRSSRQFGSPLEAVGPDKQRRLRRLAGEWLSVRLPEVRPGLRPARIRFDVVAVVGARVEVIKAAF
ncbi:MAG: YraN family protein [Actinomycetes bacterium]